MRTGGLSREEAVGGFISLFLIAGLAQSSGAVAQSREPLFTDATRSHVISGATDGNSMAGEALDIDGDGDIDLVIAAEFRPNILLMNDGTGRLIDESASRLPRKSHDSEDIAVADFDGDGDVDLIFVSEDDRTNEYYINAGDAHFENHAEGLPVSGTSNAVKAADFNADGAPDLLIGNAGANVLLINDGKGGFRDETALRLPINRATTQDLALADLDGDQDLDIVEANETQNRVLINDGRGHFADETEKRLPALDDQTRDVEVVDLDGDGDKDLIFANVDFGGQGDPTNRLLLNQGDGRFAVADIVSFSALRTVDITTADLNGDGLVDILSGNRWNGPDELIFLQREDGSFVEEAWVLPPLNIYPFDIRLADFNGDGKQDIYLCNFQGPDKLLLAR